ncbi:MAG: hypothetical protein JXR69_02590 [Candidatus Delongbacteria bacterium]|nr:hypothetical protein [Candidatus Delongbacteria bacterium]
MENIIPDFKQEAIKRHSNLKKEQIDEILNEGMKWDLADVLRSGGSLIFPHSNIEICGHQTAAVVHACLNSGKDKVIVLGVLHALTKELDDARKRVAYGGDPKKEVFWGIQGPGLDFRKEWENEFSLLNFLFLWNEEIKRRNVKSPELILRYPYLAGGSPDKIPGMQELKAQFSNAVIVATGDLFHHGAGYGDPIGLALEPEQGGLQLAEITINKGLDILSKGDYSAYNEFSVKSKSDARDVGQVLRYLIGSFKSEILDVVSDDMSIIYEKPKPTWVAGALVKLEKLN